MNPMFRAIAAIIGSVISQRFLVMSMPKYWQEISRIKVINIPNAAQQVARATYTSIVYRPIDYTGRQAGWI
jgi:hypothetical protein